ncbi:MAG TPA: phosphoribosylamine--glycine ligase [Thermoanaerobaculia bacterium]|jgi:phosphoribosylamine--glycine ligase|nr:phosphoribosylamine--glycine ligase [Thermoanaerobaculia bacterium]
MRVLVVGGGGREHALCWKLRQSPLLGELYCAPGNPGIAELADLVPRQPEEIHEIAGFAAEARIDLTIVGPELPLSLGLADELAARGCAVFGPTKAAAEIESSKVFAKQFMVRHGIPTAPFAVVHERTEAEAAARELGLPVVLKADGLAAGKGVLIPRDAAELDATLDTFFAERRFGASADRVVVERCLVGDEISFMVLSDGSRLLPLAACRDYKRLGEGDTGPNTGGMGAHSPTGVLEKDVAQDILERVMRPAVEGLAAEGRPLRGVLYGGLMLTSEGPQVLEFNARFGDPEAQAMLLRLEDDLLPVLQAGAAGNFGVTRLQWRHEAAACVVLASTGYPGVPAKGEPLTGLEQAAAIDGVHVFHAATARRDGQLVSAGGRVLNVCATGPTLREALKRAYGGVSVVDWPSKAYRRDIGRAVIESTESRA